MPHNIAHVQSAQSIMGPSYVKWVHCTILGPGRPNGAMIFSPPLRWTVLPTVRRCMTFQRRKFNAKRVMSLRQIKLKCYKMVAESSLRLTEESIWRTLVQKMITLIKVSEGVKSFSIEMTPVRH